MLIRSVDLESLTEQAEQWATQVWSELRGTASTTLGVVTAPVEFLQRMIATPPAKFEAFESRTLMSADPLGASLTDGPGLSSEGSDAAIYVEQLGTLSAGAAGVGVTASGSLTRLDKFRADARFSSITGSGFSSVIIDTGINSGHAFFGPDANKNGVADRIVYQYDFADNDANARDVNGHGSNVASIVGSQDRKYGGVAPSAGLIALKVFGDSGAGNFAYVERALQWVISNVSKYNIASVNLSLGDNGNYSSNQQLYGLTDEFAKLASMNVIVVGAAGNSFYQFGSAHGVAYPAADKNVLGVGAVYAEGSSGWKYGSGAQAASSGADRITPFSQRSTSLTPVFAPGAPIVGAGPSTAAATATTAMHGTSQAAPFVSGVAVLAQQLAASKLGRRLTPGEFRDIVSSTGAKIVDGDDEKDNVKHTNAVFKRIDVLAVGERILQLAMPQKAANTAPTANSAATLNSRQGSAITITHKMLLDATGAKDAEGQAISFRVSAAGQGTLMKAGRAVGVGAELKPGETWLWQPSASARGVVNAFSVSLSDGSLVSKAPVVVSVNLSAAGAVAAGSSAARRTEVVSGGGTLSLFDGGEAAEVGDAAEVGGVAVVGDGPVASFAAAWQNPGAADVGSRFLTFGGGGGGGGGGAGGGVSFSGSLLGDDSVEGLRG